MYNNDIVYTCKMKTLKNSTQIINSFTTNSIFDEYHKETIIKTIIINNQTGLIDFLRIKTISIIIIIINKQTLIIDMLIRYAGNTHKIFNINNIIRENSN